MQLVRQQSYFVLSLSSARYRKAGGPVVDGQSTGDVDADLTNQLYKIWPRMSSGSSVVPSVLRVRSESGGRRQGARYSEHRRSDGSGGGDAVSGALGEASVPRRLPWGPSRPFGFGCGGDNFPRNEETGGYCG